MFLELPTKQTFSLFLSTLLLANSLSAQAKEPLLEADRVIVSQDGLKVLATDRFPDDLTCEIFLGEDKSVPRFRCEGKLGRIESAVLELNEGSQRKTKTENNGTNNEGGAEINRRRTTITALRKEGDSEAYVLYLFTEDANGKAMAFFDFNLDGQWDVKKTPTRNDTAFIAIEGKWTSVSEVVGIHSSRPTATSKAVNYYFQNEWKQEGHLKDVD